jgi:hypothetical protein
VMQTRCTRPFGGWWRRSRSDRGSSGRSETMILVAAQQWWQRSRVEVQGRGLWSFGRKGGENEEASAYWRPHGRPSGPIRMRVGCATRARDSAWPMACGRSAASPLSTVHGPVGHEDDPQLCVVHHRNAKASIRRSTWGSARGSAECSTRDTEARTPALGPVLTPFSPFQKFETRIS